MRAIRGPVGKRRYLRRLLVDDEQIAKRTLSNTGKLRGRGRSSRCSCESSAGVRFFVLGLAPNAARLSVRFYIEDDFGVIAERYLRHIDRLRIDPPPRDAPSIWRMLIETAVLRKTENTSPISPANGCAQS